MTNVRDIAIIVTEQCVLIAKADTRTGFRVELLTLICPSARFTRCSSLTRC